MTPVAQQDAEHVARCVEAVLIGTAVGDAIGLPCEGLTPRRARRLFGGPPLRQRLVLGWGTVSDDTEHACMTAEALVAGRGEVGRFARSLGWRLRWWLVGLPAGVGMATARAILKLWVGVPAERSGVWSAGNGPAMRSVILGAAVAEDRERLRELVRASTRVTHVDPAAEYGALAVALAAAYAVQRRGEAIDLAAVRGMFREELAETAILPLLEEAISAAERGEVMEGFVRARGWEKKGVSGYINQTVPAAVFCWLRGPRDFRGAVEQAVLAGGDTDSTGAIVGGLVAISTGVEGIPAEWVERLVLWPRTLGYMRELAEAVASSGVRGYWGDAGRWMASVGRNIVFLVVVLVHGFRRVLPPY